MEQNNANNFFYLIFKNIHMISEPELLGAGVIG